MKPDEIRARLERIITEGLSKPIALGDVTMDSRLREDLAIDSLETVEMLFEIEEEFGIKIDDTEASEMRTVRHAVESIGRKLESRGLS